MIQSTATSKIVWESNETKRKKKQHTTISLTVNRFLIDINTRLIEEWQCERMRKIDTEKESRLAKISNLWQTDERDDKHYPTHAFYVAATKERLRKIEHKKNILRKAFFFCFYFKCIQQQDIPKSDTWLCSTAFFALKFVGTNIFTHTHIELI